ncbi:MAG: NfeD family protein [Chloroflexales bacterium]|nr:NfeD family protein [Chloroflexales bacterium]
MLHNGYMWAILGIALLLIELFLPGVYALWIGIAALFTAMIAFAVPSLDVWLLLVFAVATVLSAVGGSRIYARLSTSTPTINDMQNQLIGKHGVCIAVGENNQIRIRVNGIEWAAIADDIITIHDAVVVTDFRKAMPIARRV